MTTKTNAITTQLLQGVITNTSKKQNPLFPTDEPRKSIYLQLDEQNSILAKAFGLSEYKPKDGGEPYFIVKASETIKCYEGKKQIAEVNGSAVEVPGVENPNLTSDNKVIGLALMKGNSKGNDFIRLYAVEGVLVDNEPASPF